jgi:tetratricopeptide (TPR) repeat protein
LGKTIIPAALQMLSLTSGLLFADPAVLDQAGKLYRHTDYAAAIRLLSETKDKDPAVNEMLGQCYLMTGDYKKATDYLERAVGAEPGNSLYLTWLGRIYGRRAETSFALNAMGWASKARASLEKAVQIDASNWDAVDDLFDFYLQAPGFMGGGLDRAEKMAEIVARRDPAEGAYDRARIAESRKQLGPAEQYLKRATVLAPHQVSRLLELAKFLARHGRYEESDRTFVQAEKVAPDTPKVLFAEASTYLKSNRNVDAARELLKRYLNSSTLTPDDPPKSEAERLLRKASGS